MIIINVLMIMIRKYKEKYKDDHRHDLLSLTEHNAALPETQGHRQIKKILKTETFCTYRVCFISFKENHVSRKCSKTKSIIIEF